MSPLLMFWSRKFPRYEQKAWKHISMPSVQKAFSWGDKRSNIWESCRNL